MGIFDNILGKLGIGTADGPAAPTTPAAPATPAPAAAPNAAPATAPVVYESKFIPVVDVMAKLESLAAAHPEKLNWKTSIVDLHKLLGMDHSLQARKALAVELGCPTEKLGDSAQMNMWLHKAVLIKIAGNGGNIPQDLLD